MGRKIFQNNFLKTHQILSNPYFKISTDLSTLEWKFEEIGGNRMGNKIYFFHLRIILKKYFEIPGVIFESICRNYRKTRKKLHRI